MLGKNTVTRGGKRFSASIADLVAVTVRVGSCRIGTNVLAAIFAGGGASVLKGVADAVKLCAAMLASGRARIETNVAAIGIQSAAYGAVGVASKVVGVRKTGSRAANCANVTTILGGSLVSCGCDSYLTANVTFCITVACKGVSNGFALNYESLATVLANRTASSLGSVCNCIALVFADNSVAGGASLDVAINIASGRIRVSAECFSANYADAVAIKGIVVVANVIANSAADVANRVVVIIGVGERLRCAAGNANLSIAIAIPYVLGFSLISATVIADRVASIGILMLGICSFETASVADLATSKAKVMYIVGNFSRCAAVNASNGALFFIGVRSLAGRAAETARGRAGMQPSMNQISLVSYLTANVTFCIAGVVIGVGNIFSDGLANTASGRAVRFIGVNQVGAFCITNIAGGIASAAIGVSNIFSGSTANAADSIASVFVGVFQLGAGDSAIVAIGIATVVICMVCGTEAGSERKKRQSHSQE